jgi:hypothetical protein
MFQQQKQPSFMGWSRYGVRVLLGFSLVKGGVLLDGLGLLLCSVNVFLSNFFPLPLVNLISYTFSNIIYER